MLGSKLLALSLALGLAKASALPEVGLKPVQNRQATNCNTPTSRECWLDGSFTIDTDSEVSHPDTGSDPVVYYLDVAEKRLSPDGVAKNMLVINGTFPGPTITANWGDKLVIHVTNSMTDNGTSIHWHGISQVGSNTEDGANGVTECPIAPGQTRTYAFTATQHGTAWYHSHYSGQYGDGVLGSIVVNGPATANYTEDLGPMTVTDYYTQSMWEMGEVAMSQARPPTAPKGLINGMMKNDDGTGAYSSYTVEENKSYRLRIINTGIDNGFKVSLDGHPFTVIQADFVPLHPYETDWLFVGIGQRYDVIINANKTPGNYWFRAEVASALCGSNAMNGKIKAIFSYSGVAAADPTTTASDSSAVTCADPTGLESWIEKTVPEFTFVDDNTDKMSVTFTTNPVNTWTINDENINIEWDQPTLRYLANGTTDINEIPNLALYDITVADKWYYWVIQNLGGVPHPIHLHGHEFSILGQTNTTNVQQVFTSGDMSKLNLKNPPRRDVATLPARGWMVIAFQANNPGVWLMHCHIAWHVSQGFGVQFMERVSEIPQASLDKVEANCAAWDTWYGNTEFKKPDSGLRRA